MLGRPALLVWAAFFVLLAVFAVLIFAQLARQGAGPSGGAGAAEGVPVVRGVSHGPPPAAPEGEAHEDRQPRVGPPDYGPGY